MGEKNKSEKFSKDNRFFDNLIEFLSDCDGQSTDELKNEIEESGIKVGPLLKNAKLIIEKNLTRERLRWQEQAKKKQEAFLNKISSIPSNAIAQLSKSQLIERIRNLVPVDGGDFSIAYRNLEEMTEDDLRNALEELEKITALEKHQWPEDEE
ncbi:MAG: hypothetical protein ACMUIP_06980 [bacterium]